MIFFLFCILVGRPIGGGGLQPSSLATLLKNTAIFVLQGNIHTWFALFEVFYNSGKKILSRFFEVFIMQLVITVGITLVDSALKTYTCIITLKYIDKWKQFQTRDDIFIKYNLNFLGNITIQYKSHKIYVREPQFAHRCHRLCTLTFRNQ